MDLKVNHNVFKVVSELTRHVRWLEYGGIGRKNGKMDQDHFVLNFHNRSDLNMTKLIVVDPADKRIYVDVSVEWVDEQAIKGVCYDTDYIIDTL